MGTRTLTSAWLRGHQSTTPLGRQRAARTERLTKSAILLSLPSQPLSDPHHVTLALLHYHDSF